MNRDATWNLKSIALSISIILFDKFHSTRVSVRRPVEPAD